MYRIMGKSRFGVEEPDTADNLKEAKRLVSEYRMAFGTGWHIWYEEGE